MDVPTASYAPLSADDVQGLFINNYLTLIAFTLIIYEYLITIDVEVERFWVGFRQRPPWAAFLFFINRYVTILGHIPIVFEYFWYSLRPDKPQIRPPSPCIALKLTASRCDSIQSFHEYFVLVVQVIICALLLMRMYALYNQSKKVLAFLLVISAVCAVVASWSIVTGQANEDKKASLPILVIQGCPTGISQALAFRLAVAWIGLLGFDCAVFGLTVFKTLTLRKTAMHGANLLNLLLRDGTTYFGVMIISNIANMLSLIYGQTYTRGVLTPFTNIISSILISRLMLNLRGFTANQEPLSPTTPTGAMTVPMFRKFRARNVDTEFGFDIEEAMKSNHDHSAVIQLTPRRERPGYRSEWYPTVVS